MAVLIVIIRKMTSSQWATWIYEETQRRSIMRTLWVPGAATDLKSPPQQNCPRRSGRSEGANLRAFSQQNSSFPDTKIIFFSKITKIITTVL